MKNLILGTILLLNFSASAQLGSDTLRMIEEKYGEQWDFCTCIIKNDSINKAFSTSGLSDEEFDLISKRFDFIESKCKAFLLMYENNTPEGRAAHVQRVKDCLKEE